MKIGALGDVHVDRLDVLGVSSGIKEALAFGLQGALALVAHVDAQEAPAAGRQGAPTAAADRRRAGCAREHLE